VTILSAYSGDTMSWVNCLGYAASASVLATFCMSTMVPLRAVAICSNVLFAAYGALVHIYPVLLLHVILLPVNIFRLIQVIFSVESPAALAVASITIAPLLGLVGAIRPRQIKTWVSEWQRRACERRELVNLCERERHDLRISCCDIEAETLKPFWRA
jgi:uncharacterized protein YjiS (DUF1127 family)